MFWQFLHFTKCWSVAANQISSFYQHFICIWHNLKIFDIWHLIWKLWLNVTVSSSSKWSKKESTSVSLFFNSCWVAMSSLSAVDFLVAVFFKLIWHGSFLIISSSSSQHEKWEHTDRQSLSSNRLLQTRIFFVTNIFNEQLSTDVLRTLVYFPP